MISEVDENASGSIGMKAFGLPSRLSSSRI